MKGKTAQSEKKEVPKDSKRIIKKVLDGKDVRKMKGGKVGYAKGGKMCYMDGGPIQTAKGMGAAVKGGKFHEA
jgi:hypothetical protein